MPYVLSKLANATCYNVYAKSPSGVNIVTKRILIAGGADVTDKNLIMPEGVVTKIDNDELAILQENKVFQNHLEKGYVRYYKTKPDVDKEAVKLSKDNSKQLTDDDYTDAGKSAPVTEAE